MKLLLLLSFFTLSLFGYSREYIENYTTKLLITNDGKAKVTEEILYNFGYDRRHGIYRDIPKNDTKISNLKVFKNGYSTNYELYTKDNFWRIKIGSANSYVSGRVGYTIKYNLEGRIVRNRGNKNYIIFDIIGTAWKKPIMYAKGVIYLPKKLQNRVTAKAFRGKFGSTKSVPVKNLGSRLELETTNLAPHEGLTISIAFDPSLMKVGQKPSYAYYKKPIYLLFIAPILALFWFFGKKLNIFGDVGSIAPKYRPPKELTVMESGLLKDNFVDFKELKAAILELANLGFIKFQEDENGTYLKKLKDADNSLTPNQVKILNELFGDETFLPSTLVKFRSTWFEDLKASLHDRLVQKGYYGSSVKSARQSFIFAAVGIGILTLGAFLYYISKDTGADMIIPVVVAIGFLTVGLFNLLSAFKSADAGGILFSILWILFSGFFLYSSLNSEDIALSLLFMVLIIAIGSYLIYKKANTLTFKGILAKRHLLGLREFIDKADKDKIKFFLQEDKNYLDKVLPYAVLFGLNKHWLNLYKELETPIPDWYDGSFDSFNSFDFEPTSYSESSTGGFSDGIGSAPSIDTGDFGGFGDFSGGGFGGGGGDSW